jgi:hypothetical protein
MGARSIDQVAGVLEKVVSTFGEVVSKQKVDATTEIWVASSKLFPAPSQKDHASDRKAG